MSLLAQGTMLQLLRLDALGRITSTYPANDAWVGRSILEAVLPDDRPVAERLLAAARRGEPRWAELTFAFGERMQRALVSSVPGELGTVTWALGSLAERATVPLDDPADLERWIGRFLVEGIEIGVLVFDASERLRYRNAMGARLLGLSPFEIPLGLSFQQLTRLIGPGLERSDEVLAEVQASLREGRALRQFVVERRDGTVIEFDYLPVREGGEVVAHVFRFRDITARRAIEQRALAAEQRYRELVELLPVVVYRAPVTAIAETSYVSPQIEQLLGYTPEEWLSRRGMWARHVHPEDREWVIREIERAVAEGGRFALEYRMLRRDGTVVWVQDWGLVQDGEGDGRFIHGVMLDVTARKRTEEARAEAERRLAALVQAMPAVVYVVDAVPVLTDEGVPAYPVRYVNEHFERLTGYSPEALLADPFLYTRLIHPDDQARYAAEALRTDETGEVFDLEYRLVRRDGSVIWVRERAVQLRDQEGRPVAWQGLTIDITAQKETEQALRAAEQRYRALVEQLPGALLVVETEPEWQDGVPSFRLVYASPQIESLTGYAPADWAEPAFWMRSIHPDDRAPVLGWLERALAERRGGTIEYRLRRKDGLWRWIRHEATLVSDEQGQPRYWQSLLLDVTAEKEREEARREAEERFRLLAEHHPVAVTIVEPEPVLLPNGTPGWRTLYSSPRILDVTGYTPEEWAQLGIWIPNIHPDDRDRVLKEAQRWYVEGPSRPLEYRFRRKDGRTVWLHQEGALVRDAEGRPRYLYLLTSDVTEQRELMERLRAAEERYRALVEQLPSVVLLRPLRPDEAAFEEPYPYVSPAIRQLTGYGPDEWSGARFRACLHPDDRERVLAAIMAADCTGSPLDIEYRLVRRDGSVVWVWSISRVVTDADGTPLYRQVLLTDITERKRVEEAHREAEARYRTLIEQFPGAVLLRSAQARPGPDGRPAIEFFYISPTIERLTGFTPEEWRQPGRWSGQIHPDDRERCIAAMRESEERGTPLELEYRYIRKDGRVIWLWHVTRIIQDADGAPLYRQVLLLDITERKRAEEALRKAEAHYRTLVEQLPAAVVRVAAHASLQPDGYPGYETTYVSPQIETITGFTPEEWKEPGIWARRLHPDDREWVLAAFWEHERTGEPLRLEYRLVRKDDSVVWLWHEVRAIRGPDGAIEARQAVFLDVTERKQAEEALREAEECFRTLVEQLPAALVILEPRPIWQPDGVPGYRTTYVSPRIFELTGYTPAEWAELGVLARSVHPDDRSVLLAALEQLERTGEPIRVEYRFVRKDGQVVWHRNETWPVRGPDGAVRAWHALILDVTPEKEAERALREAEERYRTLVEQLPAVVYVEGVTPIRYPNGRVDRPLLYVSPQIEELTGYSPEEHQRDRSLWVRAIHPDDYQRVRRETREAWATGRFHSEFRIVRRDGSVRWLESTARLIRDSDGKPLYWQGVMLDVTARKEVEQRLREAEERYRTLVEQIPAAVIVTAATPVLLPDGTLHYPITYVSQRIEEITGFTREEFEATPGLWFARMHPQDQPHVFAEALRTDQTGEPFTATYRFQRKDGRWVWLENRAVMVHDAQGQPLVWHGLLIDVTDRKRAEQLLIAQTTLLRMIAEAAPLSEILELLCHLIEAQAPGLWCSVLLLGSDGRLYHGAAPSLPPEYTATVDGLAIGPAAGSCGTAAFLNQPVFVEDTSTDPRWAAYRDVAARFGLRACWSTPIRDATGSVLGTVALYASEPRGPRPEEEHLLELATQLAALALERWRESEELRHRAFHDPLTGLANRLLFLDRLEHARARAERDGGAIAVLFVDLDDFKRINDSQGHAVGDLVLREIAERLARNVRAGDTVARFAGDEFTVLLEGVTDPTEVLVVAERLGAVAREPIAIDGLSVQVGLSIGAVFVTGSRLPDSGSLLLAADQALYAAKRRGKQCVELTVLGEATEEGARLAGSTGVCSEPERSEG